KLTWIVENLVVYPEKMKENLAQTRGLIFSQRILLALMEKGVTRSESYDLVQQAASRIWETDLNFKDVLINTPQIKKYLSAREIEGCFDLNYYLRYVDNIFKMVGL
ncbi:MAG: adenylosuccinate lyase, partial [Candidatus Omnitrophica bacterium]|nr:adenylosuccinate lyase [Candidatus Omnitrophota bacterium]